MDQDTLNLIMVACILRRKKKESVSRRRWTKNWLLKRNLFSHITLINELRLNEPDDFRNYLRMNEETYTHLLNLVTPWIKKKDTVMRAAITPHERLTATLRFLATGRSYEDLKYTCAISKQALSEIIPETCYAIYEVLREEYLKFPSTEEEWLEISNQFDIRWQFPHCLGAIDGKHIQIIPPAGSGSYYYNYKGTHSIVLMAIANANYEFLLCDVGTNGRVSDGGVIENTTFYSKLCSGAMNLPRPPQLSSEEDGEEDEIAPSTKDLLNYVFVSDEAFTMRTDFLKPYNQRELDYSKRIFNYRLSRARRIVENVFGILVHRFRIFEKPINLMMRNIDIVVLACCTLHNYLRRTCGASYVEPECLDFEDMESGLIIPGYRTNDNNMIDLKRGRNRNTSATAKEVRDQFKDYFNNEGAVSWQSSMIRDTSYNRPDKNNVSDDHHQQCLEEEMVDDVEIVQPQPLTNSLDENEIEMDSQDEDYEIEEISLTI